MFHADLERNAQGRVGGVDHALVGLTQLRLNHRIRCLEAVFKDCLVRLLEIGTDKGLRNRLDKVVIFCLVNFFDHDTVEDELIGIIRVVVVSFDQ